jgi:2'-5' RNA ligase
LHITLKFVGEKPAEVVEQIQSELSTVRVKPIELRIRAYGFFPSPKAARVFWIGIEAGPQLGALAAAVDEATARCGVAREAHAFSPHLTLARAGGGSGAPRWRKGDGARRTFQTLQEKLAALPASEFGTMTAREFFLYQSQLLRESARYTKIARFQLA